MKNITWHRCLMYKICQMKIWQQNSRQKTSCFVGNRICIPTNPFLRFTQLCHNAQPYLPRQDNWFLSDSEMTCSRPMSSSLLFVHGGYTLNIYFSRIYWKLVKGTQQACFADVPWVFTKNGFFIPSCATANPIICSASLCNPPPISARFMLCWTTD